MNRAGTERLAINDRQACKNEASMQKWRVIYNSAFEMNSEQQKGLSITYDISQDETANYFNDL